jgi:hypothetical protein
MSQMTLELDGVEDFRPIQGLDPSIARNIRVVEDDGQLEAIVSGSGKQPEIRLNDVSHGAPDRPRILPTSSRKWLLSSAYRHRIIP